MTKLQPVPTTSLLKVPNQQRSIRMVHTIIDAAIQVLQRNGNIGFSTHSVAKEAGISIGSLHQYFSNKDMIISAIVERGVLQADTFMGTLFRTKVDAPLETILRQAIKGVNLLAEPYREAIREIITATPLLADTSLLGMLRRPFLNIASDYFARNANRYELVGGYPTLIVTVDTFIFMILRRWAQISPILSDDEYYEAYITMVTSQIKEKAPDQ